MISSVSIFTPIHFRIYNSSYILIFCQYLPPSISIVFLKPCLEGKKQKQLHSLVNPKVSPGPPLCLAAGDPGSVPGLGRSPGEGNGNPLQYSYQGKPMKMSLGAYSPWGCKRVRHNLATKPQHHIVCFDLGSVPGLGRSPGEGNGNPLQYSFLGNSVDKEPGGL